MKKTKTFIWQVVLATILLLVSAKNAFSYIDPGSGSYILQILAAGVFAGLLAIKIFWNKVKEFFLKIFGRKKDEN